MAELYSNCDEFICFYFFSERKVSTPLCIGEWPCGSGGQVDSFKRWNQLKRRGEYQFACFRTVSALPTFTNDERVEYQMTRKGSRHRLTIHCLKKSKLSCERASLIINKYTLKARSTSVGPWQTIMRKLKGRVPCLVCCWQAQPFWIIIRFRCVIFGGNDLAIRLYV